MPVLVLGLLISPFVVRACRLWSVPDVGVPAELDGLIHETIPDEENFWVALRSSPLKTLQLSPEAEEARTKMTSLGENWDEVPVPIQQWIAANQATMANLVQLTDMHDALQEQRWIPKDFDLKNIWHIGPRLLIWDGMRLEAERKPREAWIRYRAALRLSYLIRRRGTMLYRLLGVLIQGMLSPALIAWSQRADVTYQDLRGASRDVRDAHALATPVSVPVMSEYLFRVYSLELLEPWYTVLHDSRWNQFPEWARRCIWWMSGEPLLRQRILRMHLANVLSQCDRHPADWETLTDFGFKSPAASQDARVPNAKQVEIADAIKIGPDDLGIEGTADSLNTIRREHARVDFLNMTLAIQAHARLHGELPADLKAVVGELLPEIPRDPFGKSNSRLQYRREGDEAVMWSVGLDGIDDDGRTDWNFGKQPGDLLWRIRLPRPEKK